MACPSVGLSIVVDASAIGRCLAAWFPALKSRVFDDLRAAAEAERVPIVCVPSSLPHAADFPTHVNFLLFPGTNGEEVAIGLALARLFSDSLGCRSVSDGSGLGDDSSPYWSIVQDGERAFLADDCGTAFADGAGGPIRVVREFILPIGAFDAQANLIDPADHRALQPHEGRDRLFGRLWSDLNCHGPSTGEPLQDPFLLAHLPRLAAVQSDERLATAMADGPPREVLDRVLQTALALSGRDEDPLALQWLDLALRLAAAAGDDWLDWSRIANEDKGFVLARLGRPAEALQAFRTSLAAAVRLVDQDLSSIIWLKGNYLRFAPDRIVDRLEAKGHAALAIEVFRVELELYDAAAEEPHWLDTLFWRGLQLGEMLLGRGDRVGALAAFRAVAKTAQRLDELFPGGEFRQLYYYGDEITCYGPRLWLEWANLEMKIAELLLATGDGDEGKGKAADGAA